MRTKFNHNGEPATASASGCPAVAPGTGSGRGNQFRVFKFQNRKSSISFAMSSNSSTDGITTEDVDLLIHLKVENHIIDPTFLEKSVVFQTFWSAPFDKARDILYEKHVQKSGSSPASTYLAWRLMSKLNQLYIEGCVPGVQKVSLSSPQQVLDFLISNQLISRRSPSSNVLKPKFVDFAKFREILLCKDDHPCAMDFVGRELEMRRVVEDVNMNISFPDMGGGPVVIVHGIPGSGKSRFLAQVGNRMITKSATMVLAITFKNNYRLIDLDHTFCRWAPHLPLCFRLLHAYACIVENEIFDVWCGRISTALKSVDDSGFSRLTVLSVIDFLRDQVSLLGTDLAATKFPVLCLADEVLMPWNESKSYDRQDYDMIRPLFSIQGSKNQFAVVFSTPSDLSASYYGIQTHNRRVSGYRLMCLDEMAATTLVREYICQSRSFFRNFGVPEAELADRILASVGALPRALRIAFNAFDAAQKSQRHLSLREILESVALKLTREYVLAKEFKSDLLISAVLGAPALDNCAVIAGNIYHRGGASGFHESSGILQLDPVQLVSYSIQYSQKTSTHGTEVDAYLADDLRRMCNAPNSNRNIFEQVHQAQLHLRCHHYYRSRDQGGVTVLDIFPGSRILMGPQEWLKSSIDFTVDISRTIYMFRSIPTPEQLTNVCCHLLCVPDEPRFPGIGGILFLLLPGRSSSSPASKRWLAVGLQEKWTSLADRRKLQSIDVSKLASSEQKFRCMMRRRGWLAESLLFVSIQPMDLPDYFRWAKSPSSSAWMNWFALKVGNMIVIANNSSSCIRSYLGPSIFDLIEQFYVAPFSTDFVDLQSVLDPKIDSCGVVVRNNSDEQPLQNEVLKVLSDVYDSHGEVFNAFETLQELEIDMESSQFKLCSESQSALKQLSVDCVELMSRAREIDWSIEVVEQFTTECSALVLTVKDFIRQNNPSTSNEREIDHSLAASKI